MKTLETSKTTIYACHSVGASALCPNMREVTLPKHLTLYDRQTRTVWLARSRNPFLLTRVVPTVSGALQHSPWPVISFRQMTPSKSAKTMQNFTAYFFEIGGAQKVECRTT